MKPYIYNIETQEDFNFIALVESSDFLTTTITVTLIHCLSCQINKRNLLILQRRHGHAFYYQSTWPCHEFHSLLKKPTSISAFAQSYWGSISRDDCISIFQTKSKTTLVEGHKIWLHHIDVKHKMKSKLATCLKGEVKIKCWIVNAIQNYKSDSGNLKGV